MEEEEEMSWQEVLSTVFATLAAGNEPGGGEGSAKEKKGFYVLKKSASSAIVRELGQGKSLGRSHLYRFCAFSNCQKTHCIFFFSAIGREWEKSSKF